LLQLYDKDHKKIEGLIRYEDYKIESVLESCDKTLSFLYPKVAAENIELEGYIQNKTDEFVIKEIYNHDEDYISVLTKMNVESLEGKEWDRFDTTEQTIKDSLNLACAGTGWTVTLIDKITKKRTVRKTSCSSWDIIQEIKDIYRVELIFDSLDKVIKVYEKIGQDKGVYFMDSLNITSLDYNNDTNGYYTRIRAEGKDGLKLDGKGYLENYQYSNKIKTFYWKDERYTILEDLKEDAAAKLEELSKPKKSYRCDIQDLAKINKKEYSILDFTGVKEKALANGIIKDRMINNNEISGNKINIDSLITSINSNSSSTIKSTKVFLNENGQTLDVAFKNVSSNVSSLKESTTALQTEVKVHKGKIESLIKNTTISNNGASVNLKDDYVSLKATVSGINSTVSSVNSSLSSLKSKVSNNETRI